MAGPFRCTWEFVDKNTELGWSETLWSLTAQKIDDVPGLGQEYAAARCQMLALNQECLAIRCSDDSVIRDSLYGTPPVPKVVPNGTIYNPALADHDNVGTDQALNVRLECGASYRGPIFLSGLTAITVDTFVRLEKLDVDVQKAFDTWKELLIGKGIKQPAKWGIKTLNNAGDPPAPTIITAMVQNLAVWTITSAAHGLNSGDRVRITGPIFNQGRFSAANWPVTRVDANTFTLNKLFVKNSPVGYVGGGTVQKMSPAVRAITAALPQTITHRKRGRPFGQRRGRVRK